MTEGTHPPKLLHDPHSPDVFADAASGIFIFAGIVRITFEVLRADHTGMNLPERVVIGRLAMPWGAAEAVAKDIIVNIEKAKIAGASTSAGTVQ
jgi:hypothetical protein